MNKSNFLRNEKIIYYSDKYFHFRKKKYEEKIFPNRLKTLHLYNNLVKNKILKTKTIQNTFIHIVSVKWSLKGFLCLMVLINSTEISLI